MSIFKRMKFVRIPDAKKDSIERFKTKIQGFNPVIYGIDRTKKKKHITIGVLENDAPSVIKHAASCNLQLETT